MGEFRNAILEDGVPARKMCARRGPDRVYRGGPL